MIKTILTIAGILFFNLIYCQYDLDVERNARIQGELFVEEIKLGNSDNDYNTIIGWNSGNSSMTGVNNTFLGIATGFNQTDGNFNTFIGQGCGFLNTEGIGNTFVGFNAGMSNNKGDRNTFIGERAGYNHSAESFDNIFIGGYSAYKHESGNTNTFLGSNAGYENINGSGNIFIGWNSGRNELTSNKLYIENSTSNTPLIYGEFDNDLIKINGSFHVSDFAKLEPRSDAPLTPETGTIYYDSDDNKVKVWTGSAWENLN